MEKFGIDESFALGLDRDDPLSCFRRRFYVPKGIVYMDGNSLGLMSKDAECYVLEVLKEWKRLGIKGWFEGTRPWFHFAEELGAKCSKLVGAQSDEVVMTGTTTVNIHQLVNTFYQPVGKRTKIIADALNFPTDIYALRSLIKLRGQDPKKSLILTQSVDGRCLEESGIVELMDEKTALVFLPSVLYRSGQLLDMEYLIDAAHSRGISIGFDCSHSVGVVPHFFNAWKLDFALWCSYKYLNGGPGGSAFLYVNKRHFDREPALAGWFGYVKSKQFDMSLEFEHSRSAGGWQISSPAILSSAPLAGSLDVVLEAGIDAVREKSLMMTSYLMYLVDEMLGDSPYGFGIGTPREAERRGGHVAIEHGEAVRVGEALMARGVVADFRPPNVIRIAPSPLYNTYHEIWKVVRHLKAIVDRKEHERAVKRGDRDIE